MRLSHFSPPSRISFSFPRTHSRSSSSSTSTAQHISRPTSSSSSKSSLSQFETATDTLPLPTTSSSPSSRNIFHRLLSHIHSYQTPASSSFTALQTSFDPRITLHRLRNRTYTKWDLQYLFCFLIVAFALSVNSVFSLLPKLIFIAIFSTLLLMPITSQFWTPFIPIGTWLILFFSCGSIPSQYRPGIWVKVLPALENIFYGVNLSNILSAHQFAVLDILAWIPYGLTHFAAPFIVSAALFVFGPPGMTPSFARAFGYMNIAGVLIQLCFPCSPPWYENKYGLAPADYSMPGSPAGLARVDALTGLDMYTSSFTASPMVFGAFPSLHAGSATIEALFMSMVFPRLAPLFTLYVAWLCWATMYLSHHYAVDLVGGALLAGAIYSVAKAKFVPRLQRGKSVRFEYENVVLGESEEEWGLNLNVKGEEQRFLDSEGYEMRDTSFELKDLEDGVLRPRPAEDVLPPAERQVQTLSGPSRTRTFHAHTHSSSASRRFQLQPRITPLRSTTASSSEIMTPTPHDDIFTPVHLSVPYTSGSGSGSASDTDYAADADDELERKSVSSDGTSLSLGEEFIEERERSVGMGKGKEKQRAGSGRAMGL